MGVTQRGVDDASERMRAIAARLADLRPVLNVAGSDTVTLTDDSFRNSRSPDGSPWAPLSATTAYLRSGAAEEARQRALRRLARESDRRVRIEAGVEANSSAMFVHHGASVGRGTYNRQIFATEGRATTRSRDAHGRTTIVHFTGADGRSRSRRYGRRNAAQLEEEFGHLVNRAGLTPLVDTGRLRSSITFRAGPHSLRFGTNVSYAGPNQFGATIRPWGKGATRQLPARPFLPVTRSGSGFSLMTAGPAGAHWDRVRESVRRYVMTGEIT